MKKSASRVRIGIGGWNYKPWRGEFYPAGLPQKGELAYASSRLTSIEINSTFYGSQKPATFEKWHAETPEDFVFAVKAPMFATHRRVLADAEGSIGRFFRSGVMRLQEKLGPVNWQLDPAKVFDPADLEAFFQLLPKKVEGRTIRHAIEVRNASFATPAFPALARSHGVAVVLAGDSQYPVIADEEAPFVYARIMGTTADEPAGYAEAALDAWAARVKAWKRQGKDVFLYVISGFKARNPAAAMALMQRLREA